MSAHSLVYSNNLKLIKRFYKKYIKTKYVFKKCCDHSGPEVDNDRVWLVVMERLHDTKTNEKRSEIFNKKYAMYRCDKMKVVDIFNVNDPKIRKQTLINMYESTDTNHRVYATYEIGKIVYPDSYDENINEVCSNGIHYFKTIDCAYFYESTPKMHTGPVTKWDENGRIFLKGNYLNGLEMGVWLGFYENGDVECIGEYKNGLETGKWTHLYEYDKGSYFKELLSGNWLKGLRYGRKMEEGYYYCGKKTGLWIEWYTNGIKSSEGYYLMGNIIGDKKTWDRYGDRIIIKEKTSRC